MQQDNKNPDNLEQIAVSERRGARLLDVSPRLFRQLADRGEVKPIRIPGGPRVIYEVDELRSVVRRWKGSS